MSASPMAAASTNWSRSLCRPDSPFDLFLRVFMKSSMKPMSPKKNIAATASQT